MSNPAYAVDTDRFARCIQASKQVRWDIEADVIRGRQFDTSQKFLPDGLSHVPALTFLTPEEQRYVSQIQGRTYANMFGLVERFVNAKVLGRFPAKNLPLQDVDAGSIKMSYLGNSGSRFNRASTACIAA